jgi:Tfp pilus assembly PilM family ATPase
VGLDVGARHVRLVEADGGSRGLRVTRLGEREIAVPEGGDREEAVREAVEALFKETHAGRDDVVLAWPAEACVVRELTVPFREPEQIRKVVKFEFESHLHSNSVEEVVLDFLPVAETKEGTRLLCVAAPKAPLKARLAALEKARVDPVAVDPDVAGLAAAAAAAGALAENPDCILVDAGARASKIVLVVGGRIRAARAFRAGVETAHGPSPEAAAEPLPAAAASAEAPTTALQAPPTDRRTLLLDRLAREVSRTVANAAPDVPFTRLWISGRGALLPGAAADLGSRLGMEAGPLDLLGRVQHPVPPERLEETSAVYATAFGAAARGLGIGPVLLDLRREDVTYARRFDMVKGPVAAALCLLLLGVGFLLWRARSEKEVAQEDFRNMLAQLRTVQDRVEKDYKDALGEEQAKKLSSRGSDDLLAVPEARKRVGQMFSHLRNEMGLSTEVPPIQSCLEVLRSVNEAVRAAREEVDYCLLNVENFNQKEIQFTVILSNPQNADVLKKAIQGAKGRDGKPVFPADSVEYGTLREDRQGKWSATFTGRFEKK